MRVRAREDREEWARAMLPWVICRKTVRERPEFVQLMLQRSLDNPYPTSYVGLRRQAEAIGGHDTLDRLHAIRVPTLVTLGAEDILVPPAFSREVHARIPGAELAVIADAGHVHFLEQPDAFNAAFLPSSTSTRPRPAEAAEPRHARARREGPMQCGAGDTPAGGPWS